MEFQLQLGLQMGSHFTWTLNLQWQAPKKRRARSSLTSRQAAAGEPGVRLVAGRLNLEARVSSGHVPAEEEATEAG